MTGVLLRGVQRGERGTVPPKKISKTKKYYKIVKKWSENASREVQK